MLKIKYSSNLEDNYYKEIAKSKADKFVNWTRVIGTMFIVPSMPIISAAVIANYFRIKAKDNRRKGKK